MDKKIISLLNLRQHPVYGKLVIVLAQRTCHIIHMVAGRILFSKHRDMVISPVHCRPHQVHRTGIHADILLMDMLLMDRLCHKGSERPHHKPSHLGIDRHISHSRGNQNLLIGFLHTFSDHIYIIRRLPRLIGDAHAAGEIDKGNMRARLLPQLHRKLKKLSGKHRIIFVCNGIAG